MRQSGVLHTIGSLLAFLKGLGDRPWRSFCLALTMSFITLFSYSSWALESLSWQYWIDKTHHSKQVTEPPRQDNNWQPLPISRVNFGFTRDAYWFRTELPPVTRQRTDYLLIDFANLDHIDVFLLNDDDVVNHYRGGDQEPPSTLQLSFKPNFPLTRAPQQVQTLLIRLQSTSAIEFPAQLMTAEQLLLREHQYSLARYAFYGLMLGLATYNLLIFTFSHKRALAAYTGFVISLTLVAGQFDGISQQLIWQQNGWLNNLAIPLLTAIALASLCIFTSDLLHLENSHPVIEWGIKANMAGLGLIILLAFSGKTLEATICSALCALLISISLLMIASYKAFSGDLMARWYVVSWGMVLFFISLVALGKLGLIPHHPILGSGLKLGSAIAALLLSILLGSKIKRDEQKALVAIASTQAQTQFFANISHELRTPMNSIIGYTRRLQKSLADSIPERHQQALASVSENAQLLQKMIEDIIDLSDLEAGNTCLQAAPIDTAQLATHLHDIYQQQAEDKGLQLIINNHRHFPLLDRELLESILQKLIENAIQYTEQGSILINIGEGNDKQWVIHVQDSGCGIPSKDIPLLFQNSQRKKHHQEDIRGVGLGLAKAARCAQVMNGNITVRSRLNHGSTFSIWLPWSIDVNIDS